jgi:hypothetical protein
MSRDEAIAYLLARGLHVRQWRQYHPESFTVCGAVEDLGDGIELLKYTVVVVPTERGWSLESEFPTDVQDAPLADAVQAAADLVLELREFGRPRRFRSDPEAGPAP